MEEQIGTGISRSKTLASSSVKLRPSSNRKVRPSSKHRNTLTGASGLGAMTAVATTLKDPKLAAVA